MAADGRMRRAGKGGRTTRRQQQGRRRVRRRIDWHARQLITAIAASCVAAGSGGLIPPTPLQVPAPTPTPPTPLPLLQVQQPQLQVQPGGEEQPGMGLPWEGLPPLPLSLLLPPVPMQPPQERPLPMPPGVAPPVEM